MKTESKRALIIVGSKHGSTYDIADQLCLAMNDNGLDTVIAYPEDVKTLTKYDVIVLGSAVYMGKWLKEMRKFVDDFEQELRRKKCFMFSSGQVGKPLKPTYDVAVEVDDLLNKTDAVDHALFAGKIDKSKLRVSEKVVVKFLRISDGDYREWSDIKAWAKRIVKAADNTE